MFGIPTTPNQLVGVDCSKSAEESELLFKNPDEFVKRVDVINVHLDCVENGQQVLDRLAEHTYDLVLMDVHMPVMDGIEATQHIRIGESSQSEIPILALTASVMREEQGYYLTIGMNEVVSKPFSLRVLRASV